MIVSKNKAFVPIVSLVCAINLQAADNINLEEVVVTASGFSQSIKNAPASISIVKNDDLAKDSFTSLHSIASKALGVSVIGG